MLMKLSEKCGMVERGCFKPADGAKATWVSPLPGMCELLHFSCLAILWLGTLGPWKCIVSRDHTKPMSAEKLRHRGSLLSLDLSGLFCVWKGEHFPCGESWKTEI